MTNKPIVLLMLYEIMHLIISNETLLVYFKWVAVIAGSFVRAPLMDVVERKYDTTIIIIIIASQILLKH